MSAASPATEARVVDRYFENATSEQNNCTRSLIDYLARLRLVFPAA